MTPPIAMGVCSGNVQRSPSFEAVIKYAMNEEGYTPADIRIESAGINVKSILNNNTSLERMTNVLGAGLHYGLVRPDISRDVKTLLQRCHENAQELGDQEKAKIASFYSEIRPLVHGMLKTYRDLALEKAGVPKEYVPGIYVPFEEKEGTRLILAMEDKTLGRLEQATRHERRVPLMTYGQLVGVQDLQDDLTSGLEGAVRQVQYFMDTRRTAVTEIFKRI